MSAPSNYEPGIPQFASEDEAAVWAQTQCEVDIPLVMDVLMSAPGSNAGEAELAFLDLSRGMAAMVICAMAMYARELGVPTTLMHFPTDPDLN